MPYPELFWSWYIGLGSQTKTPELSKVLVSSVSFHHCLLLFILSLKPTGEGLQPQPRSPPDSPAARQFFSSLHLLKNQHPQKLLDTALIYETILLELELYSDVRQIIQLSGPYKCTVGWICWTPAGKYQYKNLLWGENQWQPIFLFPFTCTWCIFCWRISILGHMATEYAFNF